jgi:hypothetical protein
MVSVLTKTQISEVKEDCCPHCGELLDDLVYEDGETISLDPHPDHVDASLLWGRCENCFNVVYMLDLAIIPKQAIGNFFNDYCWISESSELYSAKVPGYKRAWSLATYRNVMDIMITEDAGSETYLISVPRLDVYRATGWPALDLADAFDRARTAANMILDLPVERENRS